MGRGGAPELVDLEIPCEKHGLLSFYEQLVGVLAGLSLKNEDLGKNCRIGSHPSST
jgi:hypothetical protein